MKKIVTVLLIEDSPDFAALVQQWLSLRTDIDFVLNWTDSLQAGLNRLKLGDVEVILLDLGLPDSNGLETFTRTKLQAFGVPMILLSGDDSEKLALHMMQAGAQDYIVKGSCNGDSLAKAIQYAVARNDNRTENSSAGIPPEHTVIGVMGVKGGVGGTTIACNLAVELRRQTDKKTLLADLDLDGGTVGFLMSAESEHSVIDAASNVDRLDLSFWEGIVAHCPGGLDVLRSPSMPGAARPGAGDLGHVFALIRKLYRWVVIDLGRPSEFSLGALEQVTELFLVTTTSVPALYEARRTIELLRKADFEGERLKLIVNEVFRTPEFCGSELDRLFGVPVYAKFSAASQELHDACVQKRLSAKNSDFRMQMVRLAGKIAGLEPQKPKNSVSQIFSFLRKPAPVDSQAATGRDPKCTTKTYSFY
jgi:Flp pilus assembly CpaE family ATPase